MMRNFVNFENANFVSGSFGWLVHRTSVLLLQRRECIIMISNLRDLY